MASEGALRGGQGPRVEPVTHTHNLPEPVPKGAPSTVSSGSKQRGQARETPRQREARVAATESPSMAERAEPEF